MDKKGVMVEEWKARRKEWKKKRKGKRGKGKSGFGKSPFCFCLTVSLPLPLFFPCTHHTTTPQHTLTFITHIIQYDAFVHTITCKQGRVLCCLFWDWTARHTLHHPHPTLHHLTSHNIHQQTQHRHSSWCKQQQDDNCQ